MKANELKSLIRQLVKEEVQSQLPKLLFEMLGSQTNKSVVTETSSVTNRPITNKVLGTTPPAVKKPIKTYAKDPILNQILNETTPGLPQSPYGVPPVDLGQSFDKIGVSDEFMGEMNNILNENVTHFQQQPAPTPEVSSADPTDLSRLFNKNFKAILNKSKEKSGGNFSGIIQNW